MVKSERPSRSKILRYIDTKNYYELLELKTSLNLNPTEYGYVLYTFLNKKVEYLIDINKVNAIIIASSAVS